MIQAIPNIRALGLALLAIGGFILLYSAPGLSQSPYPYYPGYRYPYPPQQQQRTDRSKEQRPAAPNRRYANPAYPYQQWQQTPAPAYRQATAAQQQPVIETQISNHKPYLQQNLVLTLRVVSEGNLNTLQPKVPSLEGMVIKRLSGPLASAGASEGKNTIINEYLFSVTPLSAGTLTIPPITVEGTFAEGNKRTFTAASKDPIALEVKPAKDTVRPWLPLNGLILQAYLENTDKPEAGKPIGLVIDISAVGITGNQLPSLQSQLKTDDFRIYRERSQGKGQLSPDRKLLQGSRTEHFTLVPLHGGKLQIPPLKIPWWNVDTQSAEIATIPIRQLIVSGEENTSDDSSRGGFPGASSILLWSPLIVAVILAVLFWVLAWLRKKRFIQVAEEELTLLGNLLVNRMRDFVSWISPIRRLQKIRQVFVRNLPKSFRLWFCVRTVNEETDPEVWTYMLRFLANKHLGLSPQLPLATLGQKLSRIHGSDNRQMNLLMQELESAVYGDKPIQFKDWKKRFRKQLRPRLFSNRRLARKHPTKKLPPLNPHL